MRVATATAASGGKRRRQRHPATIRLMIRAGDIPAFKVGHRYRVRVDTLRAFMEPVNTVTTDERIRRIVAALPPLTNEQIDSIVAIIRADRAA